MNAIRQDVRFALRQMSKRPGYALLAVMLLGLGIGAATSVFCVLYQALLKPLPYLDAQRLMFVHNSFPKSQVSTAGVSGFDYGEIRKHRDVFSSAGIFFWNDLTLTGFGPAQHINVVNASASLFDVLGVKAQMGRTFSTAEDQRGAPGTAILSDALWRGTLDTDPNVINRTIRLNGQPYTVVGVMPASFQFPSRETQIWIPAGLRTSEFTIEGGRTEKWLHMAARLAPGVTSDEASSALETISDGLAARFPAFYPKKEGWRFIERPLADEQTQTVRRWLYLAFGAVFAVLLIASINVSGLLLIRGTARQGEIAVRLAMGASRFRMVSQMITETGVLALAGCVLGVGIAFGAIHLVNVYGPMPQPTPVLNWAVLFAPALAVVSTFSAGLLPALLAARLSVEQTLKLSGTRTTTQRGFWRDAIMAAQIALAVALIFTAVELNRSFLNLTRVPPGFGAQHVWTGALDLARPNANFFEALMQDLASMPGVQSASGSNAIPFNPSGIWTERFRLPGREKANPPPEAQIGLALPGYFEAIGIPILRGRTFAKQDRSGALPVAVIDEELARRYLRGEDPVGRRIASGGMSTPATIIGVVGSVHNSDLGGPHEPEVYYPELQERSESMYLVLRTKGNFNPTTAVQQAIAKLDSSVALYDVQFMDERLSASLHLRQFIAALLDGLAGAGVLLSIVGLYGSLAHLVELRQREIGIRAALGATRARVVRMIFARGGIVVASGLAAGALGAALAGRAVRSQLFGVELDDATIWLSVFGAMMAAGAVSTYLPAWRAARIEPSAALRHE